MSKNTAIDPRLYVPPIEGHAYEDKTRLDVPESGGTDEVYIVENEAGLQPPNSFTIVDSIYRKGADGKTVVDLIIEAEEVAGATEYEIRTSIL